MKALRFVRGVVAAVPAFSLALPVACGRKVQSEVSVGPDPAMGDAVVAEADASLDVDASHDAWPSEADTLEAAVADAEDPDVKIAPLPEASYANVGLYVPDKYSPYSIKKLRDAPGYLDVGWVGLAVDLRTPQEVLWGGATYVELDLDGTPPKESVVCNSAWGIYCMVFRAPRVKGESWFYVGYAFQRNVRSQGGARKITVGAKDYLLIDGPGTTGSGFSEEQGNIYELRGDKLAKVLHYQAGIWENREANGPTGYEHRFRSSFVSSAVSDTDETMDFVIRTWITQKEIVMLRAERKVRYVRANGAPTFEVDYAHSTVTKEDLSTTFFAGPDAYGRDNIELTPYTYRPELLAIARGPASPAKRWLRDWVIAPMKPGAARKELEDALAAGPDGGVPDASPDASQPADTAATAAQK